MKSAAAAESASAADFCNKSATIGVLDAKPLLLRSFWDAYHQCGTFGYKVMSVWRRKNILPDKISTWRLLQLRRRWQQWKFHQIYCFAEKRVLRGQRGWVSNGKWTAGPPDDTPARNFDEWNWPKQTRSLSCSSLQVEILSGKFFFLQTLITS